MADLAALAAMGAYRLVGLVARPLLPRRLGRRVRRGKEDPARLSERYGRASRARPPGRVIWIHAASVGETNPRSSPRRADRRAHTPVVSTTVTVTAASIAADRLPRGASTRYSPIDTAASSALPATGSRNARSSSNPRSGRRPSSPSPTPASAESWSTAACRHAPSRAGSAIRRRPRALLADRPLPRARPTATRRTTAPSASRTPRHRQPQVRHPAAGRRRGSASRGSAPSSATARPGSRRACRRGGGRRLGPPPRRRRPSRRAPPRRAAPSRARQAIATLLSAGGFRRTAETRALSRSGRTPRSTSPTPSASSACSIRRFRRLHGRLARPPCRPEPIEPLRLGAAVLHGPTSRTSRVYEAIGRRAGPPVGARSGPSRRRLLARLLDDPTARAAWARLPTGALRPSPAPSTGPSRRCRRSSTGNPRAPRRRRRPLVTSAPSFWWRPRPSTAARLLWPAAKLFGLAAGLRMRKAPLFRPPVPVVCLGNYVVGGAGKTPTALALLKLARAPAGSRLPRLGLWRQRLARSGSGPASRPPRSSATSRFSRRRRAVDRPRPRRRGEAPPRGGRRPHHHGRRVPEPDARHGPDPRLSMRRSASATA